MKVRRCHPAPIYLALLLVAVLLRAAALSAAALSAAAPQDPTRSGQARRVLVLEDVTERIASGLAGTHWASLVRPEEGEGAGDEATTASTPPSVGAVPTLPADPEQAATWAAGTSVVLRAVLGRDARITDGVSRAGVPHVSPLRYPPSRSVPRSVTRRRPELRESV